MGRDVYERNALARELYKSADALLGYELSIICFEGPEDLLRQTENTQPAVFAQSMILMKLMDRKDVSMVAGHSLGEYSALVTAGSLTFEDGLRLVRLRGKLMQQAGEKEKGTMAAIVGLEPSVVEDVCREAVSSGVVQCANFNSPGQIVVSGSVDGVRKAMGIAKSRGAKMAKELTVSGAFHSPLMQSARRELHEALTKTTIQDAQIPVYMNVTGESVQKAGEIRTFLNEQLIKPVRWEQSIQNMIRDGAKIFVEVGPGKILQGLVKRINSDVEISGIDKYDDIVKFKQVKE